MSKREQLRAKSGVILIGSSLITAAMLAFGGCTNISITMAHTEGQANDVVDSEQSPPTQATVSPVISVPASLIP